VGIFTTEITSDKILSDNPIHQRLLKAYRLAAPFVNGDVLELGVGEGRGLKLLAPSAGSYTALDKLKSSIEILSAQYPEVRFIHSSIPPVKDLESNSFDLVISFQVIEHIKNDRLFLEEIGRLLRPGGKCLISTPNTKKTLTRNPWHVREYTREELYALAKPIFGQIEVKGITGSEKAWKYYQQNKESVARIMKYDIFDLQHRLPASLLRIPYEILNRINRNKLQAKDNKLVSQISDADYMLSDDADESLDLFMVATL